MIFHAIWRIFIVSFGLCLSVFFGFMILTYLGGSMLTEDLTQRYGSELGNGFNGGAERTVLDIAGVLTFLLALYPAMTILPALVVALIGEIGHIRSWLYYVLASGLGALAIPLLYVVMSSELVDMPSQSFLAIFATSGFAAGFLYWLIAGRQA